MADLIPAEILVEQDKRIDEYIEEWIRELEQHLIEVDKKEQ